MRLFVYGSLLPELARGEAARLVAGLPPGIRASVAGELYLVEEAHGCYPLLVAGFEGRVHGEILEAPDDPAWLADLDAYEGRDYCRVTMVAERADGGEEEVQAYLCILPDLGGFEPIPHGDFARFVSDTGCRVFGSTIA